MVAKAFRVVSLCSVIFYTSCQVLPDSNDDAVSSPIITTEVTEVTENAVTSVNRDRDAPEPQVAISVEQARSLGQPLADASPEQAVTQLQNQSLALQSEGRWSEAEAALERALRIDAQKANLYQQLATVRMGQNKFNEAEQIALKGLSINSNSPVENADLWQLIGQCRSANGDIAGAREARSEMALWLERQ